jgi:hypothetical protein
MKAITVNFVPDGRWKAIGWVAAMLCVGLLANAGWRVWNVERERQAVLRQIDTVQTELRQLQKQPIQTLPQDPRRVHTDQVGKVLGQDLNKVFSLVENLAEPNTRLRNLSFDSGSEVVRLEYEMDSIPRASSVTAALNAGFESGPWQLESLSQGGGTGMAGSASAQIVRGTWVSKLDRL